MKKSFLSFFKKMLFGSEEAKTEESVQDSAIPSKQLTGEKNESTFSQTEFIPNEKEPAKTPQKENFSKKISQKPSTKAKKTTKQKLLKKNSQKPLTKQKFQLGKKSPVKTKKRWKKTISSAQVKQVWPKTKDSHIRHEKVKQLEQKVSQLAAEHNVSNKEVEQATQIQTHQVIQQQSTLPHISETEQKVESAKKTGKAIGRHEILGLIEEIQKHRILTDFDRIYGEVTEKKRVSAAQISKDLEIPKFRVEECAKILEEDKLLEVDYPPVGDEFLQLPGYSEELKAEKEKQKKAKIAVKKK